MDLTLGPNSRILAPALARGEFFAAIFLVGFVNANIVRIADGIATYGLAASGAQGFGVSWVAWFAVVLCTALLLKTGRSRLSRADWAVGLVCLTLIFWPAARLSMLAVTLLSLHAFFATPRDIHLRAAAMIMAAVAVNGLWADVLLLFVSEPLLALDAHLVSWMMNVPVRGNVLILNEGGGGLTVGVQCSFVANASLALLLWIAVTRTIRPVPIRQEFYYAAVIFLCVITVNTIRISFMTVDPYWIVLFHGNTGAQYISLATMALTLLIAGYGLRRELAH